MFVCIFACMHACSDVCMYACMRGCLYLCMCVWYGMVWYGMDIYLYIYRYEPLYSPLQPKHFIPYIPTQSLGSSATRGIRNQRVPRTCFVAVVWMVVTQTPVPGHLGKRSAISVQLSRKESTVGATVQRSVFRLTGGHPKALRPVPGVLQGDLCPPAIGSCRQIQIVRTYIDGTLEWGNPWS